jgi:hypothetical protein
MKQIVSRPLDGKGLNEGATSARSPRRVQQAAHLAACGPRPILEALAAVEASRPLDNVLADFEWLPAELYYATLYHYGALADDEVPA